MTPNQAAIFAIIEAAAAADELMPTGATIAERSGVKLTSVNSALYQLADAGIIDIESLGYGKRVVTIMATGQKTADPFGIPQLDLPETASESFRALLHEPRGVCWRCQTRTDYGCEHTRTYGAVSIGEAANSVLARLQVSG